MLVRLRWHRVRLRLVVCARRRLVLRRLRRVHRHRSDLALAARKDLHLPRPAYQPG
ncbi:hypothetical protein GCM10027298_38320 [Epidermidibacterium keratini]